MSIGINVNVTALGAQRNIYASQQIFNRSLERLSSGLRIHRAADDAAGLSVAERLSYQIRGLAEAINNSQDAINLVSTAESGIDQTTGILQRIRELSIQSANDTLTNSDRRNIQAEVAQLSDQLTQIANTTEFNTRPLLNGTIAPASDGQDASADIAQNVNIGDASATVANLAPFISAASVTATGPSVDVAFQLKFVDYQANAGSPVSTAIEVRSSVDGVLTTIQLDNGAPVPTLITLSLNGVTIGTLAVNASAATLADIGKTALVQVTGYRPPVTQDQSLTFQVGGNEGQFVKAGIQDLRAAALRIEGLNLVGSSDEDSRVRAQSAIGAIDSALGYVSTVRANLGAIQNRIEYQISHLQVARENLTASHSRIRDADFAEETARLVSGQIRTQAGLSVLAQARLQSQTVSYLLQ